MYPLVYEINGPEEKPLTYDINIEFSIGNTESWNSASSKGPCNIGGLLVIGPPWGARASHTATKWPFLGVTHFFMGS